MKSTPACSCSSDVTLCRSRGPTPDCILLTDCRLSKEDRCVSLLKSGMDTFWCTKPFTVSQGVNASEPDWAGSASSGVMVRIERWRGMCGMCRLSAMAMPAELICTSKEPQGYLPTLTSSSFSFSYRCSHNTKLKAAGWMTIAVRMHCIGHAQFLQKLHTD